MSDWRDDVVVLLQHPRDARVRGSIMRQTWDRNDNAGRGAYIIAVIEQMEAEYQELRTDGDA